MPELTEYPFEPQTLSDLSAAEYAARGAMIDRAWRYYDGDQFRPLKVRKGAPDDNVIINLVQRVVDQSAAMLFGETPEIEEPDADPLVLAFWQANRADWLLHNVAVAGALSGHVFVKLLPGEAGPPRLVLLPAAYVTVFWRPDDMGAVVCYKVEWTQGATHYRQDIVRDGAGWLIRDMRRERSGRWDVTGETNWPWPFAPIIDWQNLPDSRGYYGKSDVVNLGMNDAVNFVASNINRILKHHAHPKTIALGVRKDAINETAVDGLWAIENKEASISNLEMQSDLASSMTYMEFLRTSFYSQHRAVDITTMSDRVGQLTNFGLRTLFKDALDKLQSKRTLYGAGIEEITRRAGIMLGRDWAGTVVRWHDPLPFNDPEEVATLEKELALGLISRQSAMEQRDRDWATEQERIAAEKLAEQANLGALLAAAMRDNGDA